MTVTIRIVTLRQLGACADQLKLFRSAFGSAAKFDSLSEFEAACSTHRFDCEWAAEHLLSKSGWAEYERQDELLWAEYRRQAELLWAECLRQIEGALFARLYWAENTRETT